MTAEAGNNKRESSPASQHQMPIPRELCCKKRDLFRKPKNIFGMKIQIVKSLYLNSENHINLSQNFLCVESSHIFLHYSQRLKWKQLGWPLGEREEMLCPFFPFCVQQSMQGSFQLLSSRRDARSLRQRSKSAWNLILATSIKMYLLHFVVHCVMAWFTNSDVHLIHCELGKPMNS